MVDYPWYSTAGSTDNLEQGDFIQRCPIPIPTSTIKKSSNKVESEVKAYNVIVMSQSCDLAWGKIKFILVCPYWSLSKFQEDRPDYKEEENFLALEQGNVIGYHLLNKCDINHFKGESV